jgi:hypothetical protein
MEREGRKSGLPDWMAVVLALAGFLLFLYAGQHSGSGIFARLLAP